MEHNASPHASVVRVPGGEERENGVETAFEDVVAENLPKDPPTEETQGFSRRTNIKKTICSGILENLLRSSPTRANRTKGFPGLPGTLALSWMTTARGVRVSAHF